MDFTLKTYKILLERLLDRNYSILTFQYYLQLNSSKSRHLNSSTIILRHDVDRKPLNSLKTAIIENKLGIKASYYLRIPKTFKSDIIKQISELGHEIGYHYENMDTCHGDIDKAWDDFRRNLEKLRKLYPVKTICMHGSPLSKYDNRDLWKKYDYRTEGVIGEPYLDIDWNEVFYITDTGRHWNNKGISVRDKVKSDFDIKIKNTKHILNLVQNHQLPGKIMFNIHPEYWADNNIEWLKIWCIRRVRNTGKGLIKRFRS